MSVIPYVIEQTSRGERSYDIYSRLDVYKRQAGSPYQSGGSKETAGV